MSSECSSAARCSIGFSVSGGAGRRARSALMRHSVAARTCDDVGRLRAQPRAGAAVDVGLGGERIVRAASAARKREREEEESDDDPHSAVIVTSHANPQAPEGSDPVEVG